MENGSTFMYLGNILGIRKSLVFRLLGALISIAPLRGSLIADEIKHIEKTLEKLRQTKSENAFYTERRSITKTLREELKKEFKENSRLAPLPDLDIDTFNDSIRYLHSQWEKPGHRYKAPLLLYVWSFISGIEVVGLKQNGDYYFENQQLSKYLSSTDRDKKEPVIVGFNPSNICIRKEGRCHHHGADHITIPRSFLKSAVIYRSNLNTLKLKGVEEDQRIVWEFIGDEAVSLEDLNDTFKITTDKANTVHALLNSVLRLSPHDQTPKYSLGIVKLLQNTAIYISQSVGHSRIIVGPCSVAGSSYVGLKNGIFIERALDSSSVSFIDYLFGNQFADRAFWRLYESSRTATLNKTVYYPHYEFSKTRRMLAEAELEVDANTFPQKIAGSFRRVMHDTADGERKKIIELISYMIRKLNQKQLKIKLMSKDDYEKVEGAALFEPSVSVDLAGSSITDKSLAVQPDNDDEDGSLDSAIKKDTQVFIPFDRVVGLLRCFEYQSLQKLNLSDNALSQEGALDLAKLLSKNVLPHLVKIDLSGNRIEDDEELKAFEDLLSRDNFRYLVIFSNHLTKCFPLTQSALRVKVIWVDKESLSRLHTSQKIDEIELRAHQRYFA